MASSTTNLALTKPAGGEGYSVDTWNTNMQKIDDFAGDLMNKNKGSVSSISALSTLLDTILTALGNNRTYTFQVSFSANASPFSQATYVGTLYKFGNDTTYAHVILRRADAPFVYSGARNPNGWTYERLADVAKTEVEITFTSGQTRSAINKSFTGASSYNWIAIQKPTSNENAYANVFVEYVYASGANNIVAGVNRALRNNTTESITVKLLLIGIRA